MNEGDLLDDLRRQLAADQVLVIVGAGVSIGATRNHPVASWGGLLNDGIARCVRMNLVPGGWEQAAREELRSKEVGKWLSVAEKVTEALGGRGGGEYGHWLEETVGRLKAHDRSVIHALHDLGAPILTTNYDGLLGGNGRPAYPWTQSAQMLGVIRGDRPGIAHLHGYHDAPDSVILGVKSYKQILHSTRIQEMMKAAVIMKTLLFVGVGAGLDDPNFRALRQWIAQVWPSALHRHYLLALESECESLRRKHVLAERIFPLSFGKNHGDLAGFLRELAAASGRSRRSISAGPVPLPVPRPGYCFGRDDEVGALVKLLRKKAPPPTALLGAPGIGKSTIVLEALRKLESPFGDRRYFVRCDSATRRELLVAEVARTLGITLGPNLEAVVLDALGRGRAVLVLDNVETPWQADMEATENLLGHLAGIPGLALVATIRGQNRPAGVCWGDPIRVGPLEIGAARQAFCAVAGRTFETDTRLDEFLGQMGRMPLAIDLLARQAEGQPNLEGLWKRWHQVGTTMLQRAGGEDRLTSVDRSIELSITSPAMTPDSLRLLALLGVLPDGIAWSHLGAVLPGVGETAAANLRRLALAYDESGRLRVLAPIRESVHRAHLPSSLDHAGAVTFYAKLIETEVWRFDKGEGKAAVRLLAPELANIEMALSAGLESADPIAAIRGTIGLAELIRFTGLGSPGLLDRAEQIGRALLSPGESRHDDVESVLLVATLLNWIGQVLLHRTELAKASPRYRDALRLYCRAHSVLGVANCIKGLGEIALRLSKIDEASRLYRKALRLYRRAKDVQGEANCIKGLGEIALRRMDNDEASQRFEKALDLFHDADLALGEANCIRGLGEIALRESKHEKAKRRYEDALPLFRRAGDVQGEANCLVRLGEVALARGNHGEARERFVVARELYARIPVPYSIGLTEYLLARIAENNATRRQHARNARDAFRKIGHTDFIRDLETEFPDLDQPDVPGDGGD
ncbi:MAG: tetratricopeptide repeat protein [Isosphaeraceae bacterium]